LVPLAVQYLPLQTCTCDVDEIDVVVVAVQVQSHHQQLLEVVALQNRLLKHLHLEKEEKEVVETRLLKHLQVEKEVVELLTEWLVKSWFEVWALPELEVTELASHWSCHPQKQMSWPSLHHWDSQMKVWKLLCSLLHQASKHHMLQEGRQLQQRTLSP